MNKKDKDKKDSIEKGFTIPTQESELPKDLEEIVNGTDEK